MYVGSDVGGIYDWDLVTVPQTQLDGNARPMPQGKVLGGGSILNAMCWNRGGADDYDTWEALGNPGWGWEGILPYFMKVFNVHIPTDPLIDSDTRAKLTLQYIQKRLQRSTRSITTRLCMAPRGLSKSAILDTFILSRVSASSSARSWPFSEYSSQPICWDESPWSHNPI